MLDFRLERNGLQGLKINSLKLIEQIGDIGIEMATSLIFMIMIWTEAGSIFERKVKSLTNPMAKDTLIKIETNTKSGQDLNFKNIGQT